MDRRFLGIKLQDIEYMAEQLEYFEALDAFDRQYFLSKTAWFLKRLVSGLNNTNIEEKTNS